MTAVTASPGAAQEHKQESVPALTIAALGVVFGDIGTSPLYALKEGMSPAQYAEACYVAGNMQYQGHEIEEL